MRNTFYDLKYRNWFDVYKNTVSICIYKNYCNDSFWYNLELEIRIILHMVRYASWKVSANWKIIEYDWNWHVQTWNMQNIISYASKFNAWLIHQWFFRMNCFDLLMTSAEQDSVRLSLLFEVLSYVFMSSFWCIVKWSLSFFVGSFDIGTMFYQKLCDVNVSSCSSTMKSSTKIEEIIMFI